MKTEDIKKMAQAWNQVQEASYGKKKEAMDPVDQKELKGKHKDRKDKDIDNDGDVDSSDEYLHKRRKAVSKAIKGKGKETEVEVQTQESVEELDELSKKTLSSYVKKADKQANKAADSYASAAARRHDFANDTPAMAKNAKKFAKRDAGAELARSKLAKESVEELDELSKKTLGSYANKASSDLMRSSGKAGFASGKGVNKAEYDKQTDRAEKRKSGIVKATNKLTKEEAQLDELSKKTLSSYVKKADKQANKAADSYASAAARRHDFANDTPAMAKNAKKFAKRDAGAELARSKLAKESVEELDELSKKTLGNYVKKAAADMSSKDSLDMHKPAQKRYKGIVKATDKLTKEAKDHGNTDNGSSAGEGLSPSAKDQLANKTPAPSDAFDATAVNKKTFDAMRASAKKAPMRNNDNAAGDKTAPKTGK